MVQIKTEIPHGYVAAREDAHDVLAYVRELQERPLDAAEQGELAKIAAIEIMREEIADDSPSSRAAGTLVQIMTEFAEDYNDYGEVFQPSADSDLLNFLHEVIEREHPDLSAEDTSYLFARLRDFPPASS